VGLVSHACTDPVFSMEHGNQADRVGRIEFGPELQYLSWRQVAALETIAMYLETFVVFVLVASICYSGAYLLGTGIKYLRGQNT
jgi:hypothetical protein